MQWSRSARRWWNQAGRKREAFVVIHTDFFKLPDIFLLNPIGSQDDRGAKIIGLSHVRLDEGALDDTLLDVHALDVTVSEPGGGVSHGKGGTYSSILGLDNLCSSILKKKINLVNIRSWCNNKELYFSKTIKSKHIRITLIHWQVWVTWHSKSRKYRVLV